MINLSESIIRDEIKRKEERVYKLDSEIRHRKKLRRKYMNELSKLYKEVETYDR